MIQIGLCIEMRYWTPLAAGSITLTEEVNVTSRKIITYLLTVRKFEYILNVYVNQKTERKEGIAIRQKPGIVPRDLLVAEGP